MRGLGLAVALLALAACSSPVPQPVTVGIAPLPATGWVDYQLGGAWSPPAEVAVVVRDRTDPPLEGAYSICYINGFQTQPGEAQFWLDEHSGLLVRDESGEPQFDENWPDEMALDTSTEDTRTALASIIGEWITGCRDEGYQAVEFDNLDSYSRFDGLTIDDNVALATVLVASAHSLGLAAGQKNSAELGTRGRDEIGFDFVVSEECFVYDECAGYAEIYGDQFIDIEYQRDEPSELDALCEHESLPRLHVVRDPLLVVGSDPDIVFWNCDV